MSGRLEALVRILLVSLVLTVVVDLFFVPNLNSPPLTVLVGIFGAQFVALLATTSFLKNILSSWARGFGPLNALIVAFLYATWITFVLQPQNNLGLVGNFLAILIIEASGFIAAKILVAASLGRH